MPLLDGAMSATHEPIPLNHVVLDSDALRRALPGTVIPSALRVRGGQSTVARWNQGTCSLRCVESAMDTPSSGMQQRAER